MEIETDLLERLKKDNNEFKKLYEEHTNLKAKVDELNKLKFLTAEQEMEKKKYQKQKLKNKDRITEILKEVEASAN